MKKIFIKSMMALGVLISTQSFAQTIIQEPLLDKIQKTNIINLGYRSTAIPLSYVEGASKPKGYAVEICELMIEQMKKDYNLPNLRINYVELNYDDRFDKIQSGAADLECADSTNNAERREKVDFTVPHFIAGIKILTRTDENIAKLTDLKNKRVAVAPTSTTFEILNDYNTTRNLNVRIIESSDDAKSMLMVENKEVDAFLVDDILLYAYAAQSANPEAFKVVGDFLSVKPLAIVFRKNDPNFKIYADKFMVQLMRSPKMMEIYNKWFNTELTVINGKKMNTPPSALFLDLLRYPTAIVGN